MTVNCARLIKPDQHATNGIVHVVDRVITAVSNNVNAIIDLDDDLETLRVSCSQVRLAVAAAFTFTSCLCVPDSRGGCGSDLPVGQ